MKQSANVQKFNITLRHDYTKEKLYSLVCDALKSVYAANEMNQRCSITIDITNADKNQCLTVMMMVIEKFNNNVKNAEVFFGNCDEKWLGETTHLIEFRSDGMMFNM